MAQHVCPKCGKKFAKPHGLVIHDRRAHPTKKAAKKKAKKKRKPKAKKRKKRKSASADRRVRRNPVIDALPDVTGSSVVDRLKAVKAELEAKAAAIGRMLKELAKL